MNTSKERLFLPPLTALKALFPVRHPFTVRSCSVFNKTSFFFLLPKAAYLRRRCSLRGVPDLFALFNIWYVDSHSRNRLEKIKRDFGPRQCHHL